MGDYTGDSTGAATGDSTSAATGESTGAATGDSTGAATGAATMVDSVESESDPDQGGSSHAADFAAPAAEDRRVVVRLVIALWLQVAAQAEYSVGNSKAEAKFKAESTLRSYLGLQQEMTSLNSVVPCKRRKSSSKISRKVITRCVMLSKLWRWRRGSLWLSLPCCTFMCASYTSHLPLRARTGLLLARDGIKAHVDVKRRRSSCCASPHGPGRPRSSVQA
jgi:hypothetical protein